MGQETRWLIRYNEVKSFIEENKRNPSKYAPEEKEMVNWCKQQRKLLNARALKKLRRIVWEHRLQFVESEVKIGGISSHHEMG